MMRIHDHDPLCFSYSSQLKVVLCFYLSTISDWSIATWTLTHGSCWSLTILSEFLHIFETCTSKQRDKRMQNALNLLYELSVSYRVLKKISCPGPIHTCTK